MKALIRDETGAVIVYVSVMIALIVGMGILAVDVARYLSTNTQVQNAADAASLAAAVELDAQPGAIERARAAAQQALQNSQTFAQEGSTISVVTTSCGAVGDEPASGCIRFLSELPDDDSIPIQDAQIILDESTLEADRNARYVEVRLPAYTVDSFFAAALGAATEQKTTARAIAGNEPVVCGAPPIFICNPLENLVGPDADLATLHGQQVRLKGPTDSGGNVDTGESATPGNFGYLCPLGPDVDPDDCAPSGAEMREYLASVNGICVSTRNMPLTPGVKAGPARQGFDVRFDIYDGPLAGNDDYRPAYNVTQGRNLECSADDIVYEDPATTRMGVPDDQTWQTSFLGNGDWEDGQLGDYWRINHEAPNGATGNWRPSDWQAVTGKAPFEDFTRYDLYRYELQANRIDPQRAIVADGRPIEGSTDTTTENGVAQCHPSGGIDDGLDYFTSTGEDRDLLLANDRRVLLAAVVNCQAEGVVNGFSTRVNPVDFLFLYMTDPMALQGNDTLVGEVISPSGANLTDTIAKDIVQLYRR